LCTAPEGHADGNTLLRGASTRKQPPRRAALAAASYSEPGNEEDSGDTSSDDDGEDGGEWPVVHESSESADEAGDGDVLSGGG
jgi:hypothetical protein